MKPFIISMLLVLVASKSTTAQCGKKNLFTASKWEMIDSSGNTVRSLDRDFLMEYGDKDITVVPGESRAGYGKVHMLSCEWTTPFKVGKTVFTSVIQDPDGKEFPIKVIVEGKDGKLTARIDIDVPGEGPIRLLADKFEEKK